MCVHPSSSICRLPLLGPRWIRRGHPPGRVVTQIHSLTNGGRSRIFCAAAGESGTHAPAPKSASLFVWTPAYTHEMGWLVSLFLRWIDRRKPTVRFRWSGGWSATENYIEFGTDLTNDGTKIARDIVVRGFVDGVQVAEAASADVPVEAPPLQRNLQLARPGHVDLSKALNDRPIFHRRKFTATATVGMRTMTIEWPHEDEPDPPRPLTPDEEANELRREFLNGVIEARDRQ